MKTDCDVIRDLLPLYEDEVCSEKSRDLVREHLEECQACLELLNQLHETEIENELKEEKVSVIEYGTRRFRRRFVMIGFLIALFFMIIIFNPLVKNLTTNAICFFADRNNRFDICNKIGCRIGSVLGMPESQYSLGHDLLQKAFYFEGKKSDRLKAKGLAFLMAAAEKGHPQAQSDLGSYYSRGIYVEKDDAKSFMWFQRAAEQGWPPAWCGLGLCYLWGKGVEQDQSEAVKWFKKAADQVSYSTYWLGYCYFNGEGVSQDKQTAANLYQKAADERNPKAEFALAQCYFNGEGVPQDKETAVDLYLKAANHNNTQAQFALAQCYFDGEGVEPNSVEAVYWLRSSAEGGLSEGQIAFAKRLAKGDGVEKNLQEAVIWFKKAAEQGNEEAKEALKELEAGIETE